MLSPSHPGLTRPLILQCVTEPLLNFQITCDGACLVTRRCKELLLHHQPMHLRVHLSFHLSERQVRRQRLHQSLWLSCHDVDPRWTDRRNNRHNRILSCRKRFDCVNLDKLDCCKHCLSGHSVELAFGHLLVSSPNSTSPNKQY